jgi:predicted Rossmann fold nucleotide-binding protein DprA/Smf involved in DNA uptake
MNITKLHKGDPSYPTALQTYLGDDTTEIITVLGDLSIFQKKLLALFCSVKCPGNTILQTYDLARHLRETGVTVIGGFHTPMERECLNILMRGKQPIIICPARNIDGMRIPSAWKSTVDEGRLLILSPFDQKHRRITAELGEKRNAFVAAIADRIFVAYATPGGKTEQFCRKIISWSKPLLTFNCNENTNLISIGVRPVQPEDILQ